MPVIMCRVCCPRSPQSAPGCMVCPGKHPAPPHSRHGSPAACTSQAAAALQHTGPTAPGCQPSKWTCSRRTWGCVCLAQHDALHASVQRSLAACCSVVQRQALRCRRLQGSCGLLEGLLQLRGVRRAAHALMHLHPRSTIGGPRHWWQTARSVQDHSHRLPLRCQSAGKAGSRDRQHLEQVQQRRAGLLCAGLAAGDDHQWHVVGPQVQQQA